MAIRYHGRVDDTLDDRMKFVQRHVSATKRKNGRVVPKPRNTRVQPPLRKRKGQKTAIKKWKPQKVRQFSRRR